MKSPPPVAETENCARCPAFMAAAGTTLSMNGFSVIPSRVAAQVADGVWNAVVTTLGKGTFLIRRREMQATACPLRAYEIRHIAADPSPDRNRREDSAGHRDRKGACRDLRVRVRTRQMNQETRDA